MAEYLSDKRLYLDANGKVTEDESVAVSLLVGAGGTVPHERAKELGLGAKTDDKKHKQEINKEIKKEEVEDKAVKKPNPKFTK